MYLDISLYYNKIINNDCSNVLYNIPDNSVDLIVCDAPFGNIINEKWDNKNGLTQYILNQYYRVLKNSGSLYIFCGIGEKSNSLLENLLLIKHSQFHFKDLITWKKQKGYGARKGWLYTREEIIWVVKDNKNFYWNEDNQYDLAKKRNYKRKIGKSWYKRYTNVWDDINENLYEEINNDRVNGLWYENLKNKYPTLHKTIKPVKLISRIIQAHTEPNMNYLVLDSFGGSSTTAISSIINNCNYLIIEKELKFCEISENRIRNLINQNKG